MQNGFTPLHVCAKNGAVNVAAVLAEYGSDFNARADGGTKPLHVAKEAGNLNIVKFLCHYDDIPAEVCIIASSKKNFSH